MATVYDITDNTDIRKAGGVDCVFNISINYIARTYGAGKYVICVQEGSTDTGMAEFLILQRPAYQDDQDTSYLSQLISAYNYNNASGATGYYKSFGTTQSSEATYLSELMDNTGIGCDNYDSTTNTFTTNTRLLLIKEWSI